MIDRADNVNCQIKGVVGVSTKNNQLHERGGGDWVDAMGDPALRTNSRPAYADVVRSSVERPSGGNGSTSSYHCPVCDNSLTHFAGPPPLGSACCECRFRLWCRRRDSAVGVVLEGLPGPAPESLEVIKVVDARAARLARPRDA